MKNSKKTPEKIPVVFRMWLKSNYEDAIGEVLALFPTLPSDLHGYLCSSYAHIGQHSGADYDHCIWASRPATPSEYKNLYDELVNVGYKLRVVSHISQKMIEERKRLAQI